LLYANPKATDSEIEDALKKANIWSHIKDHMKEGINEQVGASGSMLSGG
jgi:ABC-type multidrug transport system fused ATPase/permease subunit